MTQNDFQNVPLQRMAFEYAGETIYLNVNPQQYQYSRPQRATIFRTQSNNVIEQFGYDLPTITINGNTGWRKDGTGASGKNRFDKLNLLFKKYQSDTVNGGVPSTDLNFYNYTDNYSYTVTIPPNGFIYARSVDNPLLYSYTINLIVIKDAGAPNQTVSPDIGSGAGSSATPYIHADAQNSTGLTDSGNAANVINSANGVITQSLGAN